MTRRGADGRSDWRGPRGAAAAVFTALLVSAPAAHAQAWVTPRGEGAVTVSHQILSSSDHIDRIGSRRPDLGRETLHVGLGEVTYGVTDRLSTELSLVWLATKWVGRLEDRHGPLDTGDFHGTFQDIRVAARYQLIEGAAFNLAPFVAFGGPVTDYETRGHSAPGRHLEELTLGASVGGRALGRGYWQVLGSYAITNDIDSEAFNLNHLNGDVEVGASIGPRTTVRAFTSGQWMRDGLQFPLTEHLELLTNHDRFARSSYVNVGGGVSVVLSPRLDLAVTGYATTAARNFHALKAVITSLTWKFGGGFHITPPLPDVPRNR